MFLIIIDVENSYAANFLWKLQYIILGFFYESSKEQHLFEI